MFDILRVGRGGARRRSPRCVCKKKLKKVLDGSECYWTQNKAVNSHVRPTTFLANYFVILII